MSKYEKLKNQIVEKAPTVTSFRQLYTAVTGKNNAAGKAFNDYVRSLKIDLSHFTRSFPGSSKFSSKVGHRYGKLIVLAVEKQNKDIRDLYYATCKCDCGEEKDILASNVFGGRTRSCGCLTTDKETVFKRTGKNSPLWKGSGDIPKSWYSKRQRNAKERGYDFTVTIEYLSELLQTQDKKCFFSNLEIGFASDSISSDTTASMDRIDNTKGYIDGNIRWVHKDLNYMRGQMTTENFISACKMVAENF